jgi:predicted GIY-YIG superfamily endonuclease
MTVYLLHLKTPMHHARHYLGWTDDLVGRMLLHLEGNGARFTQVCVERGITFALVRTWEGEGATRSFERQLKNCKHTPRLCPVCNPDGAWNHYPSGDGRGGA